MEIKLEQHFLCFPCTTTTQGDFPETSRRIIVSGIAPLVPAFVIFLDSINFYCVLKASGDCGRLDS